METFKQVMILGAVTLCFLSTFTDSAALRSQTERTNLHTILKRLDTVLDNLIEERDDTDGSLSFLNSKRNEDGSIPYKRNEDGSVPYKRNEDGSIPYKRNEDGSIPYKRNEDGSIPYKRNEDGSIPYKRRESFTNPDDSLHDVLTYILALEEENQGTIHQKRDHDIPFPFKRDD